MPSPCPKCTRPIAEGRPACMYCGARLEAMVPCKKCGRPLVASAPKCAVCGTTTGVAKSGPTAADLSRARVEVFQAAERARSARQFTDALRLYEHVVSVDPKHARSWFGIAKVQVNAGDPASALVSLGRALDSQPDLEEARALRATLEKSPKLAAQQAARQDALGAGFADAGLERTLERAVAFVAAGRFDEALGIFERLVAGLPLAADASPTAASLFTYHGVCLKGVGRATEALAAYDRALHANPSYAKAWANKGDLLDDMGRLDEAIAAFERAVTHDPNDAKAWSDRGYVLRKKGRVDAAIQSYDRAITLDPRQAIAWNNKGNALLALERYDEAAYCLDRAAAIDPAMDSPRATLAKLVADGKIAAGSAVSLGRPGVEAPAIWQETAAKFAEDFPKWSRMPLDFSPASVRALDVFLDLAIEPPDAQPADEWRPDEHQQSIILGVGAYLGEVFRRVAGGKWMIDLNGNQAPYSCGVAVGDGAERKAVVLPFMRVLKRLKYGDDHLWPFFASACEGAGAAPFGAAAAWASYGEATAQNRLFEEARDFADTALRVEPTHDVARRLRQTLDQALGGPLPPGVPGPTLLELAAQGEPAAAFVLTAVAGAVPKEKILVVSWQIDVPLTHARTWRVPTAATQGIRAHAITTSREAIVACYEADADEAGAAHLPRDAMRAWCALLESGRVASVRFVANKPWSSEAALVASRANEALAQHGVLPPRCVRLEVVDAEDDDD